MFFMGFLSVLYILSNIRYYACWRANGWADAVISKLTKRRDPESYKLVICAPENTLQAIESAPGPLSPVLKNSY